MSRIEQLESKLEEASIRLGYALEMAKDELLLDEEEVEMEQDFLDEIRDLLKARQ